MNRVLYIEGNSGISGDMFVAAMLDLGADANKLEKVLKSLPVDGFRTEISRVKKAGLDMCDFAVHLDSAYENHDADMEYLFGREHEHEHHHEYPQEHHREHHCEHRSLADVEAVLDATEMTESARGIAKRIFRILAEGEAKAHGTVPEQVKFHEVGAVDSIADITAAAVCFDDLGISEVCISSLTEGTGTVRCAHGILPIPVPAVSNIAEMYALPLTIGERKGELITPTGAAVAAVLMTTNRLPDRFTIEKIGLGAGKRQYEIPSFLRVMILQTEEENPGDTVTCLETNLDDCTGEMLGRVMNLLLEAGARDVWVSPVTMKKNRPGNTLHVLCDEPLREALETIIFAETTAIGTRRYACERTVLPREVREVSTPLGNAKLKVVTLPDGRKRAYPEYESVTELCTKSGLPFREVWDTVLLATGAVLQ